MNRIDAQREAREAIEVSDRLSRQAHADNEHEAAGQAASARSSLDRLERQLGRRRVSPLVARKLDRVLGRLVDACEKMKPEHRANAASLISHAELLRMELRESSRLFPTPGEKMQGEVVRAVSLIGAGALLLAVSVGALSR